MKQKQSIKLNEAQLRQIIKETIINEYDSVLQNMGLPNNFSVLPPSQRKNQVLGASNISVTPPSQRQNKRHLQPQGEQTINEYNGSDAVEDAENSGYDEDDPMYQYILQNGGGGILYEKQAKNMKKQTIKINESQLRNIIKEALNELDWKTYANAAKKQADVDGEYKLSHDKPNRAYKFNLAASNEFNKKYRHNGNYTDDFTRLHANEPTNWETTELPKLHLNASDLCDDEHGFLGRDFDEKDKPYWVNKNQHGELKQVKKIPPKTFERHPELMQKFKDAEQEMEHYYNGDYDYTTDKGWHLKESQLSNIIKESIKKVLKESETPIVIGNEDYGDLYRVALSNGDYSSVVFNVYCYSAQDAIDEAVDYAENQGWNGLFDDEDEEAINEFPDDYITAGNHGHYLRIDRFVVRKV